MNVTSIDYETATLNTASSRILNLNKQLKFVRHKLRRKQSSENKLQNTILNQVDNFLKNELQHNYSGDVQSDMRQLQQKLITERNQHQYETKINEQKIMLLQEQCETLQHEIDNKEYFIKAAHVRQKLINQEFRLSIANIKNQMQYQQCIDINQNSSRVYEKEEIFTLPSAMQTNEMCNNMQKSSGELNEMTVDEIKTNKLSRQVQTDLIFDELMIQLQNGKYVESTTKQQLNFLRPLENKLSEVMPYSSNDDENCDQDDIGKHQQDNCKRRKKAESPNELFSFCRIRSERRRRQRAPLTKKTNDAASTRRLMINGCIGPCDWAKHIQMSFVWM